MTDQLRECPFCNGDGELDIDENHNHFVSCIECRAEGSRAACASDAANAWNTRPTAVASHAEGEVVEPVGYFCFTSNDRKDIGQVHPMHKDDADVFPLYSRSGDEARDAARWRKFLSMVDPDKVPSGFTLYFAVEEGTDQLCYADNDITEIVDAAMAARGGEKAA